MKYKRININISFYFQTNFMHTNNFNSYFNNLIKILINENFTLNIKNI
jgi:hypothetical protein